MNTARCPRCDADAETLLHVLRGCKITKRDLLRTILRNWMTWKESHLCEEKQWNSGRAQKMISIPSPFATEAVACTMAMKLCLDLGLRRLKVERDSFTVCTFMHVWRSANGVAHQL
ncbi:hypothetical protein Godav_004699, partial [Gossypium davidsonii]|nr:hypothetical protein [Gossypium davidsonii]